MAPKQPVTAALERIEGSVFGLGVEADQLHDALAALAVAGGDVDEGDRVVAGRLLADLPRVRDLARQARREMTAVATAIKLLFPDATVEAPIIEAPIITTACAHCRGLFPARRSDTRYCSPAHRQAAYRAREREQAAKTVGKNPLVTVQEE